MKNGQIYHINFKGHKGTEINNIHLGIVFTIPHISNMVFCIPLTSPKEKHFKTKEAFDKRNHLKLKHQTLIYIDQTDSIALLDQIRTISIQRLLNTYKNINNNDIVLTAENLKLVETKTLKFLKHIFAVKKDKIIDK